MRRFSTEEAAREYLEKLRWPNGPTCPHCGNANSARIYKIEANPAKKIRAGLYKCAECKGQFTVTVDTVMEDSHIPLNKWLIAFYLMMASKKSVSALQLQRVLEIGSYRSAWFMCHRIRHALRPTPSQGGGPLKGTVEADETYIGGKRRGVGRGYRSEKAPVVAMVQRGGRVRSVGVDVVDKDSLAEVLLKHVATTAKLNTDELPAYVGVGKKFAHHDTVNHRRDEYVRHGARVATTNTVEGYFSLVKRAVYGTYHQIGRKYLRFYLAEFDHRYNLRDTTDGARTDAAIKCIEGKRLMLYPSLGKPRTHQ
ncbi:MAG TPA: IS1595 family transposase [Polyangia bacterium]|nr:IS1595 family transposase [Polyangia bacterium]